MATSLKYRLTSGNRNGAVLPSLIQRVPLDAQPLVQPPTRYGGRCKPGLRQLYYRRSPGTQHPPPLVGLTRTLGAPVGEHMSRGCAQEFIALASVEGRSQPWRSQWWRSCGLRGCLAASRSCRAAFLAGALSAWRGRRGSFPVAILPFRLPVATLLLVRPTRHSTRRRAAWLLVPQRLGRRR